MRYKSKSVDFLTLNDPRMEGKLDARFKDGTMHNYVVVVDEAHNFFNAVVNDTGYTSSKSKLKEIIMEATDTKVIFMTGTPMINDPFELVPCVNMLAGQQVITNDFIVFQGNYYTSNDVAAAGMSMKNTDDFRNRMVGLVSYSAGD